MSVDSPVVAETREPARARGGGYASREAYPADGHDVVASHDSSAHDEHPATTRPRQARRLAARLAESGRGASPELYGLLADRASAATNYLAALMIMIIIALMVWRPGA